MRCCRVTKGSLSAQPWTNSLNYWMIRICGVARAKWRKNWIAGGRAMNPLNKACRADSKTLRIRQTAPSQQLFAPSSELADFQHQYQAPYTLQQLVHREYLEPRPNLNNNKPWLSITVQRFRNEELSQKVSLAISHSAKMFIDRTSNKFA